MTRTPWCVLIFHVTSSDIVDENDSGDSCGRHRSWLETDLLVPSAEGVVRVLRELSRSPVPLRMRRAAPFRLCACRSNPDDPHAGLVLWRWRSSGCHSEGWCPSLRSVSSVVGSTLARLRSRWSTSRQTCAEGRTAIARSQSHIPPCTCAHQEQCDGYVGVVAKRVHLFRKRRRFGVGVGRLRLNRRSALRAVGA